MKINFLSTTFATTITTLFIASTSFIIPQEVLANKALVNRQLTTPVITRSTTNYEDFIIEFSAGTLPIKDLEIILPQQITSLEDVMITDNSGKQIEAELTKNEDQVLITFSELVQPGNALRITFADAYTQSIMGETLLYRLNVQQEGLQQRIPIGTARIEVPDAS